MAQVACGYLRRIAATEEDENVKSAISFEGMSREGFCQRELEPSFLGLDWSSFETSQIAVVPLPLGSALSGVPESFPELAIAYHSQIVYAIKRNAHHDQRRAFPLATAPALTPKKDTLRKPCQ